MKTVEIKDNIYWVGAVDWNLRDFHGYSTEKGSTYNAYLLRDEKTVLFDTVKADLCGHLVDNIKSVCDPQEIDYIVVNHAEMDHTGSLPEILKLAQPKKIICNAKCRETLIAHYHDDSWPFEIIKEDDTFQTGAHTIQFLDSKMLHWPESMASFIPEKNLLISNDIFGQHWSSSERFDDEVDQGELYWQAAKYFANIFYPFCPAVGKFLTKLEDKNIHPDMLAVDHGLIWRSDVAGIMAAYKRWSSQEAKNKAVVVFDTMWGSTKKMAEAIGKGLAKEDISTHLFDLRFNHRSDVITEILEARAVVVGSSVMNNNLLPKMADMLTYMKGLKPSQKIAAAFGSYGWSNKGVKMLNEALESMKFEIVDEGVASNYVPTPDVLESCEQLGRKIGQAIKA